MVQQQLKSMEDHLENHHLNFDLEFNFMNSQIKDFDKSLGRVSNLESQVKKLRILSRNLFEEKELTFQKYSELIAQKKTESSLTQLEMEESIHNSKKEKKVLERNH
jgi:hypothetical protein